MSKPIIITRVDQYDKIMTEKLLYLSYDDFNKCMSKVNSHEREVDENNAKIWEFSEYNKLKNICKHAKSNNFSVKELYSYADGTDDGRLFLNNKHGGGLQNINRYFRGLLCGEKYTDIDMKNCHPNLLKGLCRKHNIQYEELALYCHDRDKYIKELMKKGVRKDDAKKLFLMSMNSSNSISTYKINSKKYIEFNEDDFFYKFDKEMKEIQNKLYEVEEYKKNIKSIKERKGNHNTKGRLLNSLLCIIENEIIQEVIKNGFKVDVPMFDGFMTLEKISNRKEYLSKLDNLEICRENTIKWDIKEHILDLYDDIMKIEKHDKKYYYGTDIVDLAKQLLKDDLNNRIFRYKTSIYYKTDKIWIKEDDNSKKSQITSELTKLITDNYLYIETKKKSLDGDTQYEILNKSIKNIKDLIDMIFKLCKVDNNKVDEIWSNSLYKIVFNNGYYDFQTRKFETNFDYIDTFYNISYDLNLTSDKKIRKQIYDIILNPIFSIDDEEKDKIQVGIRDNFLYRIARTMAGHIEDKLFYLMVGMRDCGKGVSTDLIKKCFQGYIRAIESGNLLFKKTSGDASKNNSWIVDCEFSRLAISQEIKLDEKEFIDGNLIKKFCSGGDHINGRQNYVNEREFKLQSSLMICCNNIPVISPSDTMEKAVIYDMKSKFINEDYDEKMKLSNIKYYPMINDIKTKYLNDKKIINEFTLIILEHYNKPCSMPKEELNNINESYMMDDDIKKIKEIFTQGNNENKLTYNELKQIMKDNDINMTINKLLKHLNGTFKIIKSNSMGMKNISGVAYIKPEN